MPELPEVETVRKTLETKILNKEIEKVQVLLPKMIKNVTSEEFSKKLSGQKILEINRKGKHLIIVLTDYYLLSHLRMEGKYLYSYQLDLNKHDHIVFEFKDKSYLVYNDTRKFGTMYLFDKSVDIFKEKPLSNLGLEPFDENLTTDYLAKKFGKKRISIKQALLDQSIISGIGNIYADEILFDARIHPTMPVNAISRSRLTYMIESIRKIMNKAISLGGTTIRTFESSHGITGKFQNELLVHTKESCPVCHGFIKKIRVNGRGTYFCPHCQTKGKCRIKVGITGGIAMGKSLVTSILQKRGFNVIDCDVISHEVFKLPVIKKRIGKELELNETFDRKDIGKIVFNNPLKLKKLEKIMMPKIVEKMRTYSEVEGNVCFIDAPVLFEQHLEKEFDKIIVVHIEQKEQIKRLMERDNLSRIDALLRIKTQIDINIKKQKADYTIYSDTVEHVEKQIKQILEEIKNEI